jgi:hypothetical protein
MPVWCAVAVASLTFGVGGCGQKSTDTTTGQSTTAQTTPAADASAAPADASATAATDGNGVIDYRTKDPASLGIPIYPGAKTTPNGSVSSSDKTGSGQVVNLDSPDSFDTVYAWYKSQLPADAQKMKTSLMGASTATFQVGTGDEKSGKFVTVSSTGKGDTIITLTVGTTTAAAGSSPAADAANAQQSSGAQHDDLSTFGVPNYPNASESVMLPAMVSDEGKAEHGQLTTKDSFGTVYAWYKQRLPAGSESAEAAASNHINSDGDDGALFEISKNPQFSVLIARSKGDADTTVVFMRLTKNK